MGPLKEVVQYFLLRFNISLPCKAETCSHSHKSALEKGGLSDISQGSMLRSQASGLVNEIEHLASFDLAVLLGEQTNAGPI